jgi:hypothetical protein
MRAGRVERPPHSDVGSLAEAMRSTGLIGDGASFHAATSPRLSNGRAGQREFHAGAPLLRLMAVPAAQHDLDWLKQCLQAAVTLELSTIPPYLCAWWSIKDDGHPAAEAVREVVMEEMLHLGLACNLLTTLGGTPQLDTPEVVPTYPGTLPGNVRPSVRVALSGLTKEVLSGTFMEIEYPEEGPVARAVGETFPTIGAFYTAIAGAFAKLPPGAITGARQLTSSGVGLFKINTPADAQKAISQIKQQGEGTTQSPLAVDFGGELAHYYRFAEIWHERRLVRNAGGEWKFEGDPLPFPDTYPMAEVPLGGYPESLAFDTLYTEVLHKLQAAWTTGSQAQLGSAVSAMFALSDPARTLMQMPRPSGGGTFGPSFRLIVPGSAGMVAAAAAPVLPQPIVTLMAARGHRVHHYLWHEVRNNWHFYDESTRAAIRALGWEPPRPAQQPGAGGSRSPILDNDSGEDFLFMYHQMIALANQLLAKIGDLAYPRVEGWLNLPQPRDGDYPVPPAWDSGDAGLNAYLQETKSDAFFQQTMQSWERQLTDLNWLRGRSLGEVGARIEFTIHNRMHMRWCSNPGDIRPDIDPARPGDIDGRWDAAAYDWLGDTYSSHVHPWFWKIHGWVDARIEDWKRANGVIGPIAWKGTWVGQPLPEPGLNALAAMLMGPKHDHAANLKRLLRIVQRSGVRSRFYDPINIPDSGLPSSPVTPFVSLSQEPLMAKRQPQHDAAVETEDFSAAVQDLTQVAQSLAASAQQMMQTMQILIQSVQQIPQVPAEDAAPAVGTARINVWEDDPFSEKEPTQDPELATLIQVPVPVNNQPLLQFRIAEPATPAALYHPGTPQFRFWEATEALTRGIRFWGQLLPNGTVWSAMQTPLPVHLVAGEDFNANYSRRFGLRFYRGRLQGKDFFSAESPDVSCHELGHGILDAVRPELFNAASAEVAAFHESFGDMSAILSALQVPSLRGKVLDETGGRLNINSRLSRLAEQLGWAIRQVSPTSVDADCLRNAANRFFYVDPDSLPPSAPSTVLSSEGHSFSRVFTGAFLDALSRMLSVAGAATSANLLTVSGHMGQLLVDGVRLAPVTANYYSQVAAAMIQAGATRYGDRYRAALTSGFVQHGILAPAAAALTGAPVPQLADGGSPLLTMGEDNTGYRSTGANAPDLPTRPIKMMGLTIEVHAPRETPRFSVASAALGIGPAAPRDADQEAQAYVEDLIQRGQVELEPLTTNMVSSDPGTSDGRAASKKTHTVVAGRDNRMVLKRLHFNCGCGNCRPLR